MMGQFRVFDGHGMVIKMATALAPIFLAIPVAISRVVDNRHHWEDVIAGSALGIIAAIIVYPMFFRVPWSSKSDEPYTKRLEDIKQQYLREDENNHCADPYISS